MVKNYAVLFLKSFLFNLNEHRKECLSECEDENENVFPNIVVVLSPMDEFIFPISSFFVVTCILSFFRYIIIIILSSLRDVS